MIHQDPSAMSKTFLVIRGGIFTRSKNFIKLPWCTISLTKITCFQQKIEQNKITSFRLSKGEIIRENIAPMGRCARRA